MTNSRKYDSVLKSLFSHPEMIRSLIKSFVSDKWVNNLDFESLTAMKSEHITFHLKERRNDLVWKIRSNEQWLYLILLLEFQSQKNKFMPVRILSYGSLIYEDLIKNHKKTLIKGKLPPIFPIVFYTGTKKWNGPHQFRECLSDYIPRILMDYQFHSKYLILDIGRVPITPNGLPNDNLVFSLIELERAKTIQEVNFAINTALQRLQGQADSLKRAFFLYSIKALKVQERFVSANLEKFSEVSMLYERADQMWDQFAKENQQIGQQIGRQVGEEIGEKRGEYNERKLLIKRLIEKKFPKNIQEMIYSKIEQASSEQLSRWIDEILEDKFELVRAY